MALIRTGNSKPGTSPPKVLQKLGALLALCAVLMASGVHTVALQSYGWAKMFEVYSESAPVATAIELTFSGQELCGVCVLSQATQQDLADSLELTLDEQKPLVQLTQNLAWQCPSPEEPPQHGFTPPRNFQEIRLAFDPPPPRSA